ncbi:hypothetical protein ACEWY4_003612 [Coilia grayii]|uniref:Uncharacterized protein n=1 Tax=Coilia grayii TaxID=363190 RepID=A0ABD1KSC4_9TELE
MFVYFLSISALLCCVLLGATHVPSTQVSQEPRVISLTRLNASAAITCSYSGPLRPHGLSLKRRFNGNTSVLYKAVHGGTETVHAHFAGRLTVTGQCCSFTIQLSLLQVADTDGYYCSWQLLNGQTGSAHTKESDCTIVVVRERDPKEPCSRPNDQLSRLFLGVSVVVCAIMLLVFIGALIWRFTLSKGRYEPQKSSQHKLHHRQNRPLPLLPPPHHHHHHHHHHHLQTQCHHHHHQQQQHHSHVPHPSSQHRSSRVSRH